MKKNYPANFGPQNKQEELIFAGEEFRIDVEKFIWNEMLRQKISNKELAERLLMTESEVEAIWTDEFEMSITLFAKIIFVLGEEFVVLNKDLLVR